jgi:hypothetical protein
LVSLHQAARKNSFALLLASPDGVVPGVVRPNEERPDKAAQKTEER